MSSSSTNTLLTFRPQPGRSLLLTPPVYFSSISPPFAPQMTLIKRLSLYRTRRSVCNPTTSHLDTHLLSFLPPRCQPPLSLPVSRPGHRPTRYYFISSLTSASHAFTPLALLRTRRGCPPSQQSFRPPTSPPLTRLSF